MRDNALMMAAVSAIALNIGFRTFFGLPEFPMAVCESQDCLTIAESQSHKVSFELIRILRPR